MENQSVSIETFKKIIDSAPIGATLWEAGRNHENWKNWILKYSNNRLKDFLNIDMSGFIGQKARGFPENFDRENFKLVFKKVIETGEMQMATLSFGPSAAPKVRLQFYFIPLNKTYIATFYSNVTLQVQSKNQLKGRIADLEEVNRYMISREVRIATFKRKMDLLSQELKQLQG